MHGSVLAIDAGGTKIHIAIAQDGKIVGEKRVATLAEKGGKQAFERMILASKELIRQTGFRIQSVGLASPGVVHLDNKTTEFTWNIPGWDALGISEQLQQVFSVPVIIENDANMAAIAEDYYGDHGASFIMFAIGTGFGSGIIFNHQLWTGAHGAAGEIARWVMNDKALTMHLNYGHLEYLMSGSGFETRYYELSGKRCSGQEIAALEKKGDSLARLVFDEGALYLGITAANAATLLDLDTIVLSGGVIMKHRERWIQSTVAIIEKFCLYPPKVVVSNLGDRSVLFGALVAAYHILERNQ
ncbi:ROK family protein [Sporolactobacillus terrae]|uniref:ROK family protein n=1 Tax=Sporolactobacillus terrae TaxID=269673 RepID=UPI001E3471C3|nr:ROK family protein [Sporolactobacillus terrae]